METLNTPSIFSLFGFLSFCCQQIEIVFFFVFVLMERERQLDELYRRDTIPPNCCAGQLVNNFYLSIVDDKNKEGHLGFE